MQKTLLIKSFLIFLIALILLIPISMISSKIDERYAYKQEAMQSVADSWTGHQKVVAPIIVIPYEYETEKLLAVSKTDNRITRKVIKSAKALLVVNNIDINANIQNDVRHLGIYSIPVYASTINMQGAIDIKEVSQKITQIKNKTGFLRLNKPYLSLSISDPRGIDAIPSLKWSNQSLPFFPSSLLPNTANGIHAFIPEDTLDRDVTLSFSFSLALRGMEQLSFVPVAKEAKVSVSSNWEHPQFIGSFLPSERDVNKSGYTARWRVTSFASDIIERVLRCERLSCDDLTDSYFGIKHIEAVDVYVQSDRSVKYSLLFIGLSFIAFFLFELLKKLPIHPVQYILVGVAIAVFYLLLFSLAEHMNFAVSYLIASMCCVGLLMFYLFYVLQGIKQSIVFSLGLLLLYGLLYVIISAEDYALLMGSVLLFITVAAIMVLTRHIDWYSLTKNESEQEATEGSVNV